MNGWLRHYRPRGNSNEAPPAADEVLRSWGDVCGRCSRSGTGAAVQIFKRRFPPRRKFGKRQPVDAVGAALRFFQAAIAAQKKAAKRKRWSDLAGPAGQIRAANREAAGCSLFPPRGSTAEAPPAADEVLRSWGDVCGRCSRSGTGAATECSVSPQAKARSR